MILTTYKIDVHPKIWYHAGIVSGQRYNDKGQVLYNPPGPNPPARHQGRRHDTIRPA